jgi:hypothetical protein
MLSLPVKAEPFRGLPASPGPSGARSRRRGSGAHRRPCGRRRPPGTRPGPALRWGARCSAAAPRDPAAAGSGWGSAPGEGAPRPRPGAVPGAAFQPAGQGRGGPHPCPHVPFPTLAAASRILPARVFPSRVPREEHGREQRGGARLRARRRGKCKVPISGTRWLLPSPPFLAPSLSTRCVRVRVLPPRRTGIVSILRPGPPLPAPNLTITRCFHYPRLVPGPQPGAHHCRLTSGSPLLTATRSDFCELPLAAPPSCVPPLLSVLPPDCFSMGFNFCLLNKILRILEGRRT